MREIICMILLLSTTTHSDNSVPASIQVVPLGKTVKIPCKGYGNDSITVATWFYRREDKSFETIVSERNGMIFHGKRWIRIKLLWDFNLEFRSFTEEDKGIYVCELCTNTLGCTKSRQISLIPQYETGSPTSKTHFIIEGGRFSYSCLHNETLKVGWTFKVQGGNTVTHVNSELTDRGLLSILDVQPSHSGIYRCWRETLTGQWETVYSLTLCVLTVSAEEMTDSPQNCTLYCDVDVDVERDLITVGTDKGNISVTGTINKPKSSVICRINISDVETNRTSLEEHNITQSGATEDRTLSHAAVPISSCAAAFFIIVVLIIILWCVKRRGMTARISCRECQSVTRGNVQDECKTQVIYSTLEFSEHQQSSVITSDHECVYSQIKV